MRWFVIGVKSVLAALLLHKRWNLKGRESRNLWVMQIGGC
jgi:hypothetical protein